MTSSHRPVTIVFLTLLTVAALSGAGRPQTQPVQSPAKSSASNTASPSTTSVTVTLDALTNRHSISQYVYGGAYPQDAPTITDSGLTNVRWGGDSTSTYN